MKRDTYRKEKREGEAVVFSKSEISFNAPLPKMLDLRNMIGALLGYNMRKFTNDELLFGDLTGPRE
jgi:hypothetical protein